VGLLYSPRPTLTVHYIVERQCQRWVNQFLIRATSDEPNPGRCRSRSGRWLDRPSTICITLTSPAAAGLSEPGNALPGRAGPGRVSRPAPRASWRQPPRQAPTVMGAGGKRERKGWGWGGRGWPAVYAPSSYWYGKEKSLRSRNRCWLAHRENGTELRWPRDTHASVASVNHPSLSHYLSLLLALLQLTPEIW